MNKLRQEIAKLEVEHNDEPVSLSISFGLSEFENHDTAKDVFARADKALYRAKEKVEIAFAVKEQKPHNNLIHFQQAF
jgi:PleD family two-component response regulator